MYNIMNIEILTTQSFFINSELYSVPELGEMLVQELSPCSVEIFHK